MIKAISVANAYASALGGSAAQAADLFCPDGVSWEARSELLRTNKQQIREYQDFAVQALGEVGGLNVTCTQAILLPNGLVRMQSFSSGTVAGTCERIALTIDTNNDCIALAYGSAVPNDPEALRQVDFENEMPWQNGTAVDTAGPSQNPQTSKGSCTPCDPVYSNDAGLTEEQVNRALDGAKAAWVSGLLENNATSIADTYCENGNLWGTVTAMPRNTYPEIKSYFDWFATSRNFTETILSTCPTITKIGNGVLVVSQELNLGGQCLRMQFTIVDQKDGEQCVAALDSSYVPATPAELMGDASNAGDKGDAAPSGSVRISVLWGAVMTFMAYVMM